MRTDRLAQLAALAGLRADRSAARLARVQQAIDALEAKACMLRAPMAEAPGSVAEAVMRDRWDRWRAEQVRLLNHRIARLQAAAQPQREARARDEARRRVVESLAKDRR